MENTTPPDGKDLPQPSIVWDDLCRRAGFSANLAQQLWLPIEAAYAGSARHYHNLRHLDQVLASLAQFAQPLAVAPAPYWAAIYHDVVYEPLLPGNETKSADWAASDLARLGATSELIDEVHKMIAATANHLGGATAPDSPLAIFLDCDLLILAAAPEDYENYRQAIRAEYSVVPDEVFRPGRRAILEQFLAAPRIYRHPRIFALHEAQARRNLEHEIRQL